MAPGVIQGDVGVRLFQVTVLSTQPLSVTSKAEIVRVSELVNFNVTISVADTMVAPAGILAVVVSNLSSARRR